MTAYAVIRSTDSEAVSFGTVLPPKLQRGLVAVTLDHEPDLAAEQWDPATRTLLPRPPEPPAPTLVERLAAEPEVTALTATQRTAVLAALGRIQGMGG